MASISDSTMMAHRAQIKDNVRFIYPDIGDPIISTLTHDKLWWIMVCKPDGDGIYTLTTGYDTAEAAMEYMAYAVSVKAWRHAKAQGIKLSK
ncbi:hypothetical protein KCU78_g1685, partial [Aureobasidium melanogenum]